VGPPKFWTGIIKFSPVLTAVQNFTLIGRRISEISHWKKTSQVKLKSSQKLSFPGEKKWKAKHHSIRPFTKHRLNCTLNFLIVLSSKTIKCSLWYFTLFAHGILLLLLLRSIIKLQQVEDSWQTILPIAILPSLPQMSFLSRWRSQFQKGEGKFKF